MYLFDKIDLNSTIPAGQVGNTVDPNTVNILRYLLIGSVGLYFIPLTFYWIFFQSFTPMFEVIIGFISFLFFTPTYLNILNIYSLCKIDDISWGTKGLDAKPTQSQKLLDSWKLIKFVHVAKYVIWNIIIAAVLLSLGANYRTRFWVTFGMVCLIGSTMAIKVMIGIFYMIYYKCKRPSFGKNPKPNSKSRINDVIKKY